MIPSLTGTYRPGNNVEDFKAAFRHVVYLFKGMNAPFVYQLAYNSGNPRDDKTPFSTMYPGDDVVDMVSTYTHYIACISHHNCVCDVH
jgi:beta-mannanase